MKPFTKKIGMLSLFGLLFLTSQAANKHSHVKMAPGNFNFTIQVILSDTANTGSIQVVLGSTSGASDLIANYSFLFDVKSGLPAGYGYSRRMNIISLTLGSYISGTPMYGTYIIKNKAGSPVLTKKFMYK
jgi:hypothetical protein